MVMTIITIIILIIFSNRDLVLKIKDNENTFREINGTVYVGTIGQKELKNM